jgi:lactoylglutathione lyase
MILPQVWHFSFHVRDIERSVAFYHGLLGMQLIHMQEQQNEYTSALVGYPDAHLKVAQLAVSGRPAGLVSTHDLELVEYVNPRCEPAPMERCRPGMGHMAFVVRDIHQRYEALRDNGVDFVSPPMAITAGINQGGFCCYFHDPDRITLEFVQPAPRVLDQSSSQPD